jgi:hypothetical protein
LCSIEAIQVSDPRSKEWREHLEGYLSIWSRIWLYQLTHNIPSTTLPEHGPFPYQPTSPHTNNNPLADIESVNDFINEEIQQRFLKIKNGN